MFIGSKRPLKTGEKNLGHEKVRDHLPVSLCHGKNVEVIVPFLQEKIKTPKTNDFPCTHQGNTLPSDFHHKIWRAWTLQSQSHDLLNGSRNRGSQPGRNTLVGGTRAAGC